MRHYTHFDSPTPDGGSTAVTITSVPTTLIAVVVGEANGNAGIAIFDGEQSEDTVITNITAGTQGRIDYGVEAAGGLLASVGPQSGDWSGGDITVVWDD